MKPMKLIAVAAVAFTALGGCNKSSDEAPGASAAMTDEDAQQAMGLYAEGFNELIDEPQDAVKEYTSEVPAEGPEPDKKYRLFPNHTRAELALQKIQVSFDKAADVAPSSLKHIAPLAQSAVDAAKAFIADYKRAHKYYDAEDFKDDAGKLGKELHEKLMKEAEAFGTALGKVESALSEVEAAQAEAEIRQFADDKGYSYWFRVVSNESRKLLNTSPENFAKTYPAFDTAMQGLNGFVSGLETPNAAFKSFVSVSESFQSTSKKLKRELEGAADEETVQRLRNELVGGYNNMVNVANSLRQLEANDILK